MSEIEQHAIRESNADYHANPALSASGLKQFLVSPMQYQHSRMEKHDTPALSFGRLVHVLALEPDKFTDQYAVIPEHIDRRTKAGRAEWADYQATYAHTDYEMVKQFDVDRAERIAAALRSVLPATGLTEATFRVDTEFGPLQCRPDRLTDGKIYDIKTTRSVAAFERQAFALGYHWQDAFYRYVIERKAGVLFDPIEFIAVESTPPHDVIRRHFHTNLYHDMRGTLEEALADYAQCVKSGTWPGMDRGEKPKEIQTPMWINDQFEGGAEVDFCDALMGETE